MAIAPIGFGRRDREFWEAVGSVEYGDNLARGC
jgi:hypothetical protein